jgi:hypothetical protein
VATRIEPLSIEDVSLAAMAIDDARKTLLAGCSSDRVRLDAINTVRSCGKSLRETMTAVDHVLRHDIQP